MSKEQTIRALLVEDDDEDAVILRRYAGQINTELVTAG